MKFSRKEMVARYHLMNKYVLEDQRSYYDRAIEKNKASASGVNILRSSFTLAAGITSALIAFLPVSAGDYPLLIGGLVVVSVIAPTFGSAFSTLADLYQWERLISIYETARRSLAIADSLSPMEEMPDDIYLASLDAFSESTLRVMRDESAQWGQVIKTPERLKEYVENVQQKNTDTPPES
jgi:hypothetical protein